MLQEEIVNGIGHNDVILGQDDIFYLDQVLLCPECQEPFLKVHKTDNVDNIKLEYGTILYMTCEYCHDYPPDKPYFKLYIFTKSGRLFFRWEKE